MNTSNKPYKNGPKISVIIASLNAIKLVNNTIQSLIKQTYQNFEVIIIDGGSTDGTLQAFTELGDRVTYCESAPDRGPADAHNKALKYIHGELVVFLNADDTKPPVCFEQVANEYIKTSGKFDIYTTCFSICNIKGKMLSYSCAHENLKLSVKNSLFKHGAFNCRFYKRTLLKSAKLFVHTFVEDQTHFLSCDKLWLTQIAISHVNEFIIQKDLHTYVTHPESATLSGSNWIKTKKEGLWICSQLLARDDLTSEVRKVLFSYKLYVHTLLVYLYFFKGEFTNGVEVFIDGLRIYGVIFIYYFFINFILEVKYRMSLKINMGIFKSKLLVLGIFFSRICGPKS